MRTEIYERGTKEWCGSAYCLTSKHCALAVLTNATSARWNFEGAEYILKNLSDGLFVLTKDGSEIGRFQQGFKSGRFDGKSGLYLTSKIQGSTIQINDRSRRKAILIARHARRFTMISGNRVPEYDILKALLIAFTCFP